LSSVSESFFFAYSPTLLWAIHGLCLKRRGLYFQAKYFLAVSEKNLAPELCFFSPFAAV
jgi:hypothetical protein